MFGVVVRARLRPIGGSTGRVRGQLLREALQRGRTVREDAFDGMLEERWRAHSEVHFTPLDVCRRAAAWLSPSGGGRVLDVGCGTGKFCVVASLVSSAHFVGVEQREALVLQARAVARRVGSRAEFIHADAFDVDWDFFTGLYFYNPFDEIRTGETSRLDATLPQSDERFHACVAEVQARLEQLKPGTRVVTFHGMGGPLPSSYRLAQAQMVGAGMLELWLKAR